MSSLIYDSSTIDKLTDSFFGRYIILPGQFTLLDNQAIEITKDHFRLIIAGTPNKILDYGIADSKLRYYEGKPVSAIELRLDSFNKINVASYDETVNLITNILYLRTPTVIYLTYEKDIGVYTLKNINMATMAILKKLDF